MAWQNLNYNVQTFFQVARNSHIIYSFYTLVIYGNDFGKHLARITFMESRNLVFCHGSYMCNYSSIESTAEISRDKSYFFAVAAPVLRLDELKALYLFLWISHIDSIHVQCESLNAIFVRIAKTIKTRFHCMKPSVTYTAVFIYAYMHFLQMYMFPVFYNV